MMNLGIHFLLRPPCRTLGILRWVAHASKGLQQQFWRAGFAASVIVDNVVIELYVVRMLVLVKLLGIVVTEAWTARREILEVRAVVAINIMRTSISTPWNQFRNMHNGNLQSWENQNILVVLCTVSARRQWPPSSMLHVQSTVPERW